MVTRRDVPHRVVFRADASLQIGTGHVMRCLTLADVLATNGADCQFLCRAHEGNLIAFIRAKGYSVHVLPVIPPRGGVSAEDLGEGTADIAHHHWLGTTLADEIDKCASVLAALRPDWLIVDHYALDARWERAVAPHCGRLMVIDDLADRPHACELLLDQTFGRHPDDYDALVPSHCRLLCGSQYALLRPEFATLRPYSLQRRVKPELRRLLISMGGVDKGNATGEVLSALRACVLPTDCEITVVVGATTPWRNEIERRAAEMPWPTQVKVGVSEMAKLMADSDLAIGAAGTTAWERCCMGLPAIILVLADNQLKVARGLVKVGAARMIMHGQCVEEQLPGVIRPLLARQALAMMSDAASAIADGSGVSNVISMLEG